MLKKTLSALLSAVLIFTLLAAAGPAIPGIKPQAASAAAPSATLIDFDFEGSKGPSSVLTTYYPAANSIEAKDFAAEEKSNEEGASASGTFARMSVVPVPPEGETVNGPNFKMTTAMENAATGVLNSLPPGKWNLTLDLDYDIVNRNHLDMPGLILIFKGTNGVTNAPNSEYRLLNRKIIDNREDAPVGDSKFTHYSITVPIQLFASAHADNNDEAGQANKFVAGQFSLVDLKLLGFSYAAETAPAVDFDNIKLTAVSADPQLTPLQVAVQEARDLHDAAVEGDLIGQYAAGAKAEFELAIDAADVVANDPNATESDMEDALTMLNAAAAAFLSKMNRGTINDLYVDPENGSDSNPGTEEQPFRTIEKARDSLRGLTAGMDHDVTVYLRGGEYSYADRYTTEPAGSASFPYTVRRSELILDERDSGKNGFDVVYKAYPGERPVISGGKKVTGWTLHDENLNIYKANIGTGIDTRQLYVNGKRATVARSEGPPANLTLDIGYGHTTTDTFLADWNNIRDIEFVYYSHWVTHRLKVDSITSDGEKATITMNANYWGFSTTTGEPAIKAVTDLQYIENAYELLDTEGEWYLDRQTGDLYYKPFDSEDMATANVVVPVVDELLTVKGTDLDHRVENIRFEGLTFEYAGWLQPNIVRAHVANQSNSIRRENRLPEAAVTVKTARGITFEGNEFSKLGSTGLFMHSGIKDAEIIGNKFYDLSGGGINVEDPNTMTPLVLGNPKMLLENVTISNNYIRQIGVEFLPATGITVAPGVNMYVGHNEISEIAYTAIHMGWHTDGITKNVTIENNYIHDILTTKIYDGGAIYTLGANAGNSVEPSYTVQGNYIRNQLNRTGVLYPDNNSNYWLARNNVVDVSDSPPWNANNEPAVVHTNGGTYNRFINNYTTTTKVNDSGSNNTYESWHLIPDAVWPREAIQIIANAGLEPEYRQLWDVEERFNIIQNSGFETRQEHVWAAKDAEWSRVPEHVLEGSRAAKVTPANPDGYLGQDIQLLKGLSYEASAWVKPVSGDSLTATLFAEFGDGEDTEVVQLDQASAANGEWTLLSGELDYTGEEADIPVKLFVRTADGKPYYLDEFRVVERNEAEIGVLQDAIAAANELLGEAQEGSEPGQYAEGAIASFTSEVADAQSVVNANEGEQSFYYALKQLHALQSWFNGQRVPLIAKEQLELLIDEAELLYSNVEDGSLAGMYPPGTKAGLGAAIQAAKDVAADPAANDVAWTIAYGNLNEVLVTVRGLANKLDDAMIESVIASTRTLLDTATEGAAPGQYQPGSKAALEAAVDTVEDMLADSRAATDPIIGMLKDVDGWVNTNASTIDVGEDYAKYKGRGLTHTGQTFLDDMFEVDVSFTYRTGGEWPGFALRSQNPNVWVGNAQFTGYLFLFKQDNWELQRHVNGAGTYLIGSAEAQEGFVANTHIKSGEKHRVRFGAQNVDEGVRLVMYVDDELVFDIIDSAEPIEGAGYFSIYSVSELLTFGFNAMSPNDLKKGYQDLLSALAAFEAAKVPAAELQGASLTGADWAKPEETYELTYGLVGANNVSAQEVTITFDPAAFEWKEAVLLDPNTVIVHTYQDAPGVIRFALATTGAENALSGNVPVLKLIFDTLAASDSSIIAVTSLLLADGSGNETEGELAEKTVAIINNDSELLTAIEEAQQAYAGAVEGFVNGQFVRGAKSALHAAIQAATDVLVDSGATPEQLEQAEAALNAAMTAFEAKRITASTGDVAGAGGSPDGRISVADLGYVAYHYGRTSAHSEWTAIQKADIDKDGVIDLYDLTFIGRRLAEG